MKYAVSAVLGLAALAAAVLYVEETKPAWYGKIRYPLAYEHVIRGHARNYELDAALIAAVIYRESKFDPDARSRSGAIGLMQLLPETAKISRISGSIRLKTLSGRANDISTSTCVNSGCRSAR